MKILFTSIEEINDYITVDISSNIKTLKPYIKQADKYIINITGRTLFDKLLAVVNDNLDEEKYKELLSYVRMPLANYAYYLAIAKLNINVGETGFTVSVGSNLEPASKWRIDDFKESVTLSAEDGLEELLQYLEKYKSHYPEWQESINYSYNTEYFVNNTKDFYDATRIELKRIEFIKLKKFIYQIEQSEIIPAICRRFFDELKLALKQGNLSQDNALIITIYLKPIEAYLAYWKHTEDINAKSEGERLLRELRDYLNSHADSYFAYKNSNCYEEQINNDINDTESGFYIM